MKQKVKNAVQYTIERFAEPSTWAAITAIGAIAKVNVTLLQNLQTAVPVVATALLGIFLRETKAD